MTKGISQARKELVEARAALERIRVAASFAAYEAAWQDCLTRIERSWNKTKGAFADGRYRPWRGTHEHARRNDQLLSYLSHARDAEEHTVADTLAQEPGSIGLNPAFGDVLIIESLTIRGGVMSVKSPHPIAITIQPGRIKLLPATSRGVTSPPPSEHLGVPLERADPDYVLERGIDYYDRLLADAEKRFDESRGKA